MSLMCLFPWLDYGIDIVDFENFNFLDGQPIFTFVRAGPAGQNRLFRNNLALQFSAYETKPSQESQKRAFFKVV